MQHTVTPSGTIYPPDALLRLPQIIGQQEITEEEANSNRKGESRKPRRARKAIPPLVPVCRSTFLEWVRQGKAPKPVKKGRSTFWRAGEIYEFLADPSASCEL